jgi:hypothetical protein
MNWESIYFEFQNTVFFQANILIASIIICYREQTVKCRSTVGETCKNLLSLANERKESFGLKGLFAKCAASKMFNYLLVSGFLGVQIESFGRKRDL